MIASSATGNGCRSGIEQLDVRGLPPPEPMVAILALCAQVPPGTCIVVRLDRDPVFLYPELAERGWMATRVDTDADEVRLRLERTP
jgi:TusA-related sulfurtransferase